LASQALEREVAVSSGVTSEVGRLERLKGALGASTLALAPSDNLLYALGFTPVADERACVLLLTADGAAFVVPSLNVEQTAGHVPGIPIYSWRDDEGPQAAFAAAAASLGADLSEIAVDPEMRAETLLSLLAVTGGTAVNGASLLREAREVKDAGEIAALQRSADTADQAMLAGFAACASGASEHEVAAAIAAAFREAGADEVTFSIVGAGPNGAFPHHHTSERVLEVGDAVVIDIGGKLGGYSSDITRMVHVGEPSERYREVHATVERAVQAAMAAVRPGATCGDVDRAARSVIEEAGFGPHFVHRTGHGLGLSIHEPPWIMAGEAVPLRTGMVFSIEPGIYLQGEFGVRLEDIVHVTDTGCERFSSLPRDVHVASAC
jgi:Xaa-Pro aminopeptidase